MSGLTLALLLAGGAAPNGCAQPAATTIQTVKQVDAAYRQAWTQPDLTLMADTMAEDWIVTHANGRQQDKAHFLDAMKQGRVRFLQTSLTDVMVRPYGPVAILTARARNRLQSGAQTSEGEVRLMAAYVCRAGKWRLVAEQATAIEGPADH